MGMKKLEEKANVKKVEVVVLVTEREREREREREEVTLTFLQAVFVKRGDKKIGKKGRQ